jgi:hypothetical protein
MEPRMCSLASKPSERRKPYVERLRRSWMRVVRILSKYPYKLKIVVVKK